jgi:hypothetical protein
MPENRRQETWLRISSNGGDHNIQLSYSVPRQRAPRVGLPDLQEWLSQFMGEVRLEHLLRIAMPLLIIFFLTYCSSFPIPL